MMADNGTLDKLFFKIGEASNLVGVPAYVLRFWEGEFPLLRPKRTERGQRLYRKKDIELLMVIKHLLHEKKFTIQGAKRHLRKRLRETSDSEDIGQIISDIRNELLEIRNLLAP
jgi:DNA-binding transcriptional MerR regulator